MAVNPTGRTPTYNRTNTLASGIEHIRQTDSHNIYQFTHGNDPDSGNEGMMRTSKQELRIYRVANAVKW